MEVAATDPEGLLARGLARFGSWRALAAVVGTDWLPLPRRRAAPLGPLVRRRLRALGARGGGRRGGRAGGRRRAASASGNLRAPLAGRRRRISGAPRSSNDETGLWAVEQGAGLRAARCGRPRRRWSWRRGDGWSTPIGSRPATRCAVFGVGALVPDRAGLAGALRPGRFGPRASLGFLAPVARQRDQALRSGGRWPPRLSSPKWMPTCAPPPALEAARRSGDARAPRAAGRRVLAPDPGLRRRRRRPSSWITAGRPSTRSPTSPSCWRRVLGPRLRRVRRRRAARVRAGAHVGARLAVPAVAHRLGRTRYEDPLRMQFIPLGSRLLPDHPRLDLDSLHERADMPVPGLTHRYVDKALFLALDTCPVYCRFCTRSYAVGIDTEEVEKFQLKVNAERWEQTFAYIRSRPELEDIVISGGDAYQLRAEQITQIGETLLSIDHVRRMRYATKGPGGHAAEDPDRRRLDRRAHRRGRARPQAAQGGGDPHPLQPPARDHRDHARRRWTSSSSAASPCATRRCCSAG